MRAAGQAADGTDIRVEPAAASDVRAALEDGSIDAAIVNGRIVSKEQLPQELYALLQAGHSRARERAAAVAARPRSNRSTRTPTPSPATRSSWS